MKEVVKDGVCVIVVEGKPSITVTVDVEMLIGCVELPGRLETVMGRWVEVAKKLVGVVRMVVLLADWVADEIDGLNDVEVVGARVGVTVTVVVGSPWMSTMEMTVVGICLVTVVGCSVNVTVAGASV